MKINEFELNKIIQFCKDNDCCINCGNTHVWIAFHKLSKFTKIFGDRFFEIKVFLQSNYVCIELQDAETRYL